MIPAPFFSSALVSLGKSEGPHIGLIACKQTSFQESNILSAQDIHATTQAHIYLCFEATIQL